MEQLEVKIILTKRIKPLIITSRHQKYLSTSRATRTRSACSLADHMAKWEILINKESKLGKMKNNIRRTSKKVETIAWFQKA